MDVYENFVAFQAVAKSGSFSRAALALNVAPSVITKRISQLEDRLGTKLFVRSTRNVKLTEIGAAYLDRSWHVLSEFDGLLNLSREIQGETVGFLRIKVPTSLNIFLLRTAFQAFHAEYPKVRLEIVLLDRSVNPVTEAFDVAVGAYWVSFGGIREYSLLPLERILCASPKYLMQHPTIRNPSDLPAHNCLSFLPTGNTWSFLDKAGINVSVEVNPVISSSDAQILVDSAVNGAGVYLSSLYTVHNHIKDGTLLRVLPDFKVSPLWIKAVVPERKTSNASIQFLISCFRNALKAASDIDV